MSEAEVEYAADGQRWRLREGFHLFVQGAAADALAVGPRRLAGRPRRLAGRQVPALERLRRRGRAAVHQGRALRLPHALLGDGTIASSMRLYAAEARDRWRLGPGETIDGPGGGRRLPGRDRPPAARLGRAHARRPAPLDRVRPRRPLRRLRGAGALRRRPARVPGRALSAPLTLALIADTHLPRGSRRLPEPCVERIRAADVVIHAGDFSTAAAYDELAPLAKRLVAVHGNVDDAELRRRLPEEVEVARRPDRARARRRTCARAAGAAAPPVPHADAVVFGHSHMPLNERDGDFQIFNPGSPPSAGGRRRRTWGSPESRWRES